LSISETSEADRYLTQCSTCNAFGPDVRFMGHKTGPPVAQGERAVYLCRPCRVTQGFERGQPPPEVVK
jgi:hypothetical protein